MVLWAFLILMSQQIFLPGGLESSDQFDLSEAAIFVGAGADFLLATPRSYFCSLCAINRYYWLFCRQLFNRKLFLFFDNWIFYQEMCNRISFFHLFCCNCISYVDLTRKFLLESLQLACHPFPHIYFQSITIFIDSSYELLDEQQLHRS